MYPTWQHIDELFRQYRDAKLDYWLNENLFTVNWWILFVTTVGLAIVWIIILDKKRILEIVTYGFMATAIAISSDTIGIWLFLWNYPYSLTPFPQIIEIHTIQMPILYMIIYQYFNKWKSFLIAASITAFVFAFVLEPIVAWLQIYELNQWKYIYSVVPYFAIAVLLKWIINKLKNSS